MKGVRVQLFLKRFFQRLKGFPACLAENGHKIVCREQFRRSAFFRGKQQFIPPLLLFFGVYRLNHRVPAAIQHQQITDQNAQFPLDGVGIGVAHADLNAALIRGELFRVDSLQFHLRKIAAMGEQILLQVMSECGNVDGGIVGAVHSILQLLGVAAQKAGTTVFLGEMANGLLCRCVGGLTGGQIPLQNIGHIPPVKGIRMVFFRIKKLEGEAHDIQRVA